MISQHKLLEKGINICKKNQFENTYSCSFFKCHFKKNKHAQKEFKIYSGGEEIFQ